MNREASTTSLVRRPCRKLLLSFPSGAPPPAPCIRHTRQPLTAGDWQGRPVRFDLARHLGVALHRSVHGVDGHFGFCPLLVPTSSDWSICSIATGALPWSAGAAVVMFSATTA